jgi:uncharacterized protein YaaW (UPF0174 family)
MKNPVYDKDLTQLLRHCDNEDLDPIVNVILSSPSQTLTIKEGFKEHVGDHKAYVDELVYEITSFGGNSLANLIRGQGVPYAEMVRDVATTLGIKPQITDTTPLLEEKVILRILKLSYDALEEEDRMALRGLFDLASTNGDGNGETGVDFSNGFPEEEISQRLATAGTSLLGDRMQNAIHVAARSTKIRQTITAVVKSAVAKVATLGLGGPVSWSVAVGQAIYELFGPNYTIALGLVAQIGLLRQKHVQLQRDLVAPEVAAEY